MLASRAASRAAFVIDTFAPKMRPNWTIPTTMKSSGRITAANSTIACPRSRGRDRSAGAACIGPVRGSEATILKECRGSYRVRVGSHDRCYERAPGTDIGRWGRFGMGPMGGHGANLLLAALSEHRRDNVPTCQRANLHIVLTPTP